MGFAMMPVSRQAAGKTQIIRRKMSLNATQKQLCLGIIHCVDILITSVWCHVHEKKINC